MKTIHFVGAGSGAADLITLRGKQQLEEADIIIYAGSLVNPDLLKYAKDRLSSFFDYAINDCKLKPDWMTALFINTGYAEQFERGNPAYVAGMSGVELARAVILKAYGRKELPEPPHYVLLSLTMLSELLKVLVLSL